MITKVKIKRRNFSKFVKENFLTDMAKFNFSDKIKNIDSTEEKFNLLNDNILAIFNQHGPIKERSNRETKNLLKPWITNGILGSIKVKKGTTPNI